MQLTFDFTGQQKATIYDTVEQSIIEATKIMVKARKTCSNEVLTKKSVMAMFTYCETTLKNNKKKINSYLSYLEKQANKTKNKNNKKKSIIQIAREQREVYTIKYFIKHSKEIVNAMRLLRNPFTAENMF